MRDAWSLGFQPFQHLPRRTKEGGSVEYRRQFDVRFRNRWFFFILSHIACAWLTHFKLTIFFSSPPCFLPAGIFHFCNEAIQDPDISTVQHQQPYCMKKEWLVVINAPGTGVFCPCSICKLSYSPPYTLCHILSACWM